MNQIIDLDVYKPNFVFGENGNSSSMSLEEKIAKVNGVEPEFVRVSNSSMGILDEVMRKVIDNKVGIYMPDYVEFAEICEKNGKNYRILRRNDDWTVPFIMFSLDAVIISNPNNPIGNYQFLSHLVKEAVDYDVIFIVDEAYIEFMGEEYSAARYVKEHSNVVVLRTFSKFYCMVGKENKVGYIIADPTIINAIDVEEPSYKAREIATSVVDHPDKYRVRQEMGHRKVRMRDILTMNNFELIDTNTCFFMVRHDKGAYNIFDQINVKVTDLNKNPRIENKGYVRLAIGTNQQIDEIEYRLSKVGVVNSIREVS